MGYRGSLFALLILAGCSHDVNHPFSLAPETPFSTWTPLEGNRMISSQHCKTIVPEDFSNKKLSLAELLDIALQNNPTTKKTWAEARVSAADYSISLSSFYPNLELSSFAFRQKAGTAQTGSPTAVTGSSTTLSSTISSETIQESFFTEAGPDLILSYTLFDFGQRSAASLAARESLYYADLSHNQQIQNVLQTVMNDYYGYLYEMALEKANQANLENAKMALDAANEKFALGLAALGDVTQARTQFLQSKIQLNTQKQNVNTSFAQLAFDLGLPANLPFQVEPLPEKITAAPILKDLDTLIALAQKQRQDFLALEANLRSKEALLLQAKRASLPVVNSQLTTGRYWFNQGLVEPSNHWTASISLSFPIFDGFSLRNQRKKAEANVEVSKALLLQSELGIIQSVSTAQTGVKTAAENLNDSEEYLASAKLEFDIALSNYRAGTATILEVLQAQSSLADARAKKADAQKNWFFSLADIAHATGSLYSPPWKDSL